MLLGLAMVVAHRIQPHRLKAFFSQSVGEDPVLVVPWRVLGFHAPPWVPPAPLPPPPPLVPAGSLHPRSQLTLPDL